MNYLRRLQAESPVLFIVLLFVAELILGPFGLPGWAPLALVVVALIVVARRQQNSR